MYCIQENCLCHSPTRVTCLAGKGSGMTLKERFYQKTKTKPKRIPLPPKKTPIKTENRKEKKKTIKNVEFVPFETNANTLQ